MLNRWSRLVVSRRWLVIALIVVATLAAGGGLPRLTFSNQMTKWLSRDDPRLAMFLSMSDTFGSNDLVMVLIRSKGEVFERNFLRVLSSYHQRLAEHPEISTVTSLVNIADIRKTADGVEVQNLLDRIPDSAEAMAAFKKYVLGKENLRGQVVSADGRWVAFSVFCHSGYDAIKTVKTIVIPETERCFGLRTLGTHAEFYFSGIPADAHFANQYIAHDLLLLVPVILVLISLILYFSFRSWQGVLYPLMVVATANIWLFGLMGYLKKPLTIVTPAVPVLLVALGSAYAIYVFKKVTHDVRLGVRPDDEQRPAIAKSLAAVLVPILLAGITDVIGFFSFRTVKLNLIADFGLFAGLGLIFAMLVAVSLIPALLTFHRFRSPERHTRESPASRLPGRLSGFVFRRKKRLVIVAVAIVLLLGLAIPRVNREVNFLEYFPKNAHTRKSQAVVQKYFDGAYPLIIYFHYPPEVGDADSPGARSPENLRLMRRAANFIYSLDNVSTPVFIGDFIQELNFQLNNRYALPDSAKGVANLWFFMEGRDEMSRLITPGGDEALVFAKGRESATRYNRRISTQIDDFIRREAGRGFVKFRLSALAASDRQAVRRAEARHLASEIVWLAGHYRFPAAGPAIAADRIAATLIQGLDRPWSGDVNRRLLKEYAATVASENYDFRMSVPAKEALLADLSRLLHEHRFDPASLAVMLQRRIPPGEYDRQVAEDVAATLIFRREELGVNLQVEETWQALRRSFQSDNLDFEKKVKSVLFDLHDDLAVLPAGRTSGIPSHPVAIDRIEQSGYPVVLNRLDYLLFQSQIQSLVLAYIVTLLAVAVMRRSLVLGLITTVPILLTVIFIYGFLGASGIVLDYATMMIGSICVGVGIDYAIHFMYVLTEERTRGASDQEAVRRTLAERGLAILVNSLAVMAGFAVLLFSSMLPLRHLGGVMVGAMFLSCGGALTILPAIILILKPKLPGMNKKGKNKLNAI